MNVEFPAHFPEFQANQALSDKHLNDLARFLFGQERLTRIKLIGIGIVCGLEVSRTGDVLHLSSGVAVTSLGYLMLNGENQSYRFKRPWKDEGPYFKSEPEEIWELLTQKPEDDDDVTDLVEADLEGMAAVFYLDKRGEMNDKCENDCIDRGKTVTLTPRLLLISKAEAREERWLRLGNEPPVPGEIQMVNQLQGMFSVENFHGKRPLLTPQNTTTWQEIIGETQETCEQNADQLALLMGQAFEAFSRQLDNADTPALLGTFREKVEEAKQQARNQRGVHMQSLLDWLRHVGWAYNEWVACAFAVQGQCCPDIDSFPCHVFLDCAYNQDHQAPSLYRHYFQPSPIHGGGANLHKATCKFQRLVQLILSFALPNNQEVEIRRLSPGVCASVLGTRPVPWYVSYTRLMSCWNPNHWQPYGPWQPNGYRAPDEASYPVALAPLDYDLPDETFFRAEGHIGADQDTVLQFLEEQRQQYNLPFQVVVVEIGEPDDDFTKACGYEDLRLLYTLIREELLCSFQHLGEFLAGLGVYQPTKPGGGIKIKHGDRTYLTTLLEAFEEDKADFANYKPFAAEMPIFRAKTRNTGLNLNFEPPETRYTGQGTSGTTTYSGIDKSLAFESGGLQFARGERYAFNNVLYKVGEKELAFPPHVLVPRPDPQLPAFTIPEADTLVSHLIGRLLELEELLVPDPFGFDTAAFNERRASAVEKAKTLRDGIRYLINKTLNPEYQERGFEDELLTQLGHLTENCAMARLDALMAAFEERGKAEQDNKYLAEFMREHPGLKHKSGVCAGGTLVLVCADQSLLEIGGEFKTLPYRPREPENVIDAPDLIETYRDFLNKTREAEVNMADISLSVGKTGFSIDTSKLSLGDPNRWDLTPFSLNKFFHNFTNTFGLRPLGRKTIVADFCLPYLCCDPCHSSNYLVLPEPMMRLPRGIFCKDDQNAYLFELLPPGGIVRGAGVVLTEEGYKFLPAADDVPVGDVAFIYERDIRRAVLVVRVTEPMVATFSWDIIAQTQEITTIRFTADVPEADTFKWEFGDGTQGEGAVVEHSYDNNLEEVEVVLAAANEGCSDETRETIAFLNPVLTMQTHIFCGNDSSGYVIEVQPAGGEITNDFGTVTMGPDGLFQFQPSALDLQGEESRTINLGYQVGNGVVATFEVKVLAPTTPVLHHDMGILPDGWEVFFFNQTEGPADSFVLNFGDGQSTEDFPAGSNVRHVYNEPGTYPASFTARRILDGDRFCDETVPLNLVLVQPETVLFEMEVPFRDFSTNDFNGYSIIASPTDGVVTADPPGSLVKDGLNWIFLPAKVPVELPGDSTIVKLTFTRNGNVEGAMELKVVKPATPAFEWLPQRDNFSWKVTFQNFTNGEATQYMWNFGHGTGQMVPDRRDVVHVYPPGAFEASLTTLIQLTPDAAGNARYAQDTFNATVELAQIITRSPLGRSFDGQLSTYSLYENNARAYRFRLPDREYHDLTDKLLAATKGTLQEASDEFKSNPDIYLEGERNNNFVDAFNILLEQTPSIFNQMNKDVAVLSRRGQSIANDVAMAKHVWTILQQPVITLMNIGYHRNGDTPGGGPIDEVLSRFVELIAEISEFSFLAKSGVFALDNSLVNMFKLIVQERRKRPSLAKLIDAFNERLPR